jgi:hypothetical protein
MSRAGRKRRATGDPCLSKRRFSDEMTARVGAQIECERGAAVKGAMWVYECPSCRRWHITNSNSGLCVSSNPPDSASQGSTTQTDDRRSRAEPNEVTELVERLIAKVADTDRQLAEGIEKSTVYPDEAKAAQLVVWKDQAACRLPLRIVRQAASTLTSQAEEIERLRQLTDLRHEMAVETTRALTKGVVAGNDQIATLTTRIAELEGALEKIANAGQSTEPDHWKFRCMAREAARAALTKEK